MLNAWTRHRVLDAVAGMEWHPDGAIEVLADDYRLIRYPDWALDPTFPAAQVTRSQSSRPLAEVIEEVTGRVRRWGLPGVAWWVSATTRPQDTEAVLRARGGVQIDTVSILARELDGGLPDLAVPGEVRVELVADARTFRAASFPFVGRTARRLTPPCSSSARTASRVPAMVSAATMLRCGTPCHGRRLAWCSMSR